VVAWTPCQSNWRPNFFACTKRLTQLQACQRDPRVQQSRICIQTDPENQSPGYETGEERHSAQEAACLKRDARPRLLPSGDHDLVSTLQLLKIKPRREWPLNSGSRWQRRASNPFAAAVFQPDP
jgi:hypothetical protein